MFIDKLLSPAISKALSSFTVSTQVIGSVMDFGEARNNGLLANTYGPGWVVTVKGATSGGASTINVQLVTDNVVGLASPTVLWQSGVLALTDVDNDGVQYFIPVPDTDNWEQFVAFRAVVGTAVFTGGTIDIEFVADKRKWRAYPATNNV